MTDAELAPSGDNTPKPFNTGGLSDLPIVGGVFHSTRQFFDDVAPQPSDNLPRTVAKQVFRYGAVVTASAAVATAIL